MYFYLEKPNAEISVINLIYFVKYEDKNFKYSTGQKIDPANWDFENRLPKTKRGVEGTRNKHILSVISQYSDLLEDIIKEYERTNEPLTRSILRDKFDRIFKHKKNLTSKRIPDIIQEFIDTKNESEGMSIDWNKKYDGLKRKIECYEEDKDIKLRFKDINEDFLSRYSGYLRTIKKHKFKPHNDNTLKREIDFLFTFLYWAKGKYHDIDFKELKNPVKKYEPNDIHLTTREINGLERLKLQEEDLIQVRDLFLIGVYSGQRFSDYSVFEKEDVKGDMIIKAAEKTEFDSFIPLLPKLKSLLEKYNWNLPVIHEKTFNRKLQKICKMAGIDESTKEIIYRGNHKEVVYHKKYEMVGSHTARRTFITLSSERGMPDHINMKITGIRNAQTLMKYKKTTQQSVKEQMKKYWE